MRPTVFSRSFSPAPPPPPGRLLPELCLALPCRLLSAEQPRGRLSAAPHAGPPAPRASLSRSAAQPTPFPRSPAPLGLPPCPSLRAAGSAWGGRPGTGLVIVNTRQRGSLKMAAHPLALHAGAGTPGSAAGRPGDAAGPAPAPQAAPRPYRPGPTGAHPPRVRSRRPPTAL